MLRRSNINADDYTYKCMLIYIDRSTTTIMENGHKYLATKSHILSLYTYSRFNGTFNLMSQSRFFPRKRLLM